MEHILKLTVNNLYIMNKYFKIIIIFTSLVTNFASAQTKLNKISDARKLETNKKEFIGKTLSYFLSNINMEIKSIVPVPNKNKNEINRISFLFIPYDEYKNDTRDITEKPTRITVIFGQNSDLIGDKCYYRISGCREWTRDDEKTLGDLIIYDIYVVGKN